MSTFRIEIRFWETLTVEWPRPGPIRSDRETNRVAQMNANGGRSALEYGWKDECTHLSVHCIKMNQI
jgi:hypothetical protein